MTIAINSESLLGLSRLMAAACEHVQVEHNPDEATVKVNLDTIGTYAPTERGPRWVIHHAAGPIDVTHCPLCGKALPSHMETPHKTNTAPAGLTWSLK